MRGLKRMNWNILLFGLVIAFFAYISGYKSAAAIIAIIAILVSVVAYKKPAKVAKESQVLEPIVVESTWGGAVKQMPKEMHMYIETKEAGKSEKKFWGKPLGKGVAGWVAKSIGGLFREEEE
jgi:hypothetical protein